MIYGRNNISLGLRPHVQFPEHLAANHQLYGGCERRIPPPTKSHDPGLAIKLTNLHVLDASFVRACAINFFLPS